MTTLALCCELPGGRPRYAGRPTTSSRRKRQQSAAETIVNTWSRGPLMVALLLIVPTFLFGAGQVESWTDRSGHTVSFVTVSPGVDLEVLDWGGNGPPLL